MNEICRNLYQGDAEVAIQAAQNKTVDYIIYLGQEMPYELSHESKVPVIHIPLKDGENDERRIEAVGEILRYVTTGKVLVACRKGISRSPLLCLYYLVKYNYNRRDFRNVEGYIRRKVKSFLPSPKLYWQIRRMLVC